MSTTLTFKKNKKERNFCGAYFSIVAVKSSESFCCYNCEQLIQFVVTIVESSYTVCCYSCGEFIDCLLLQLWRAHTLFVVTAVELTHLLFELWS